MIWTVIFTSVRRLFHNRLELILTFLVPIAFFSIFAVIFGGGQSSSIIPKIKVIAVDEATNADSAKIIESLRECPSLRFVRDRDDEAVSRSAASEMVRRGIATMAIVLHGENNRINADLLADASDQVAGQVVTALLSRAMAMSLHDRDPNNLPDSHHMIAPPSPIPTVPTVTVLDIMGENKTNPVVSMYAAGIAVMFLLFGATGGGGALLEERESQTLDRLLSTRLTMDQLLVGKWFYLSGVGIVQVTLMFVWGQIVFGVDLLSHMDGFLMMTVVTSSAAAGFGLCLATLCKSRGQLNGLSLIVVLAMSALGGSMVPRYVMSENLREAGLWTFNAWALDGYDKVFWRELPVSELWPQLTVLLLSGAIFLVIARILAVRWECD